MTKPLVVMVGADKGGVGKTTLSRALDIYFSEHNITGKLFDGEWPRGDLRQFADRSQVVDMQSIDHQMEVFDRLHAFSAARDSTGLSSPRERPPLKYKIALCC